MILPALALSLCIIALPAVETVIRHLLIGMV